MDTGPRFIVSSETLEERRMLLGLCLENATERLVSYTKILLCCLHGLSMNTQGPITCKVGELVLLFLLVINRIYDGYEAAKRMSQTNFQTV